MKKYSGAVKLLEYKNNKAVIEIPESDNLVFAYFYNAYKTKDTDELTMELKLPFKKRSTGYKSQNHHFWGHCQQIAKETGNDVKHVEEFIKTKAISMGYPMLLNAKGIVQKDLNGNVRGISEGDASSQESNILIEAAHMCAAEDCEPAIRLIELDDSFYN